MENRTKQGVGRLGEIMAGKYLLSKGFTIISRNFSTPFGEIDLIAKQNNWTVFVEVKARISEKFGSPLLAVTAAKQKTILRNALCYLKSKGLSDTPCRIDVIAINLDNNGKLKTLEHIKNAVEIRGA